MLDKFVWIARISPASLLVTEGLLVDSVKRGFRCIAPASCWCRKLPVVRRGSSVNRYARDSRFGCDISFDPICALLWHRQILPVPHVKAILSPRPSVLAYIPVLLLQVGIAYCQRSKVVVVFGGRPYMAFRLRKQMRSGLLRIAPKTRLHVIQTRMYASFSII